MYYPVSVYHYYFLLSVPTDQNDNVVDDRCRTPTLILSDFTLFDRNRVLSSMFSIVSNSYLFDIGSDYRGEEGGGAEKKKIHRRLNQWQ